MATLLTIAADLRSASLSVGGGEVERLGGIDALDRVRPEWDAVYAADPEAHVFLSWAWVRAAAGITDRRSLVLAYRPAGESAHVAFLPLALADRRIRGIPISRELHMGGDPFADYTGMLCRPEHEAEAIAAFAHHIEHELRWETFFAKNLLGARIDRVVQRFSPQHHDIIDLGGDDCPYIALPPTWPEYLSTRLGASSRATLRRRMRQVEALPEFRTTLAGDGNLDEQIDVLLRLRHARWGGDLAEQSRTFGTLFREAHAAGSLSLVVQWTGAVPVAALAGFVDRQTRVYSSYISGWNPTFAELSPGVVIFGHSIRWAIENGLSTYDFLRGGEAYKASFGALAERSTQHTLVERRTVRAALGRATEGAAKRTARALKHLCARIRRF